MTKVCSVVGKDASWNYSDWKLLSGALSSNQGNVDNGSDRTYHVVNSLSLHRTLAAEALTGGML